MRILFSHYLTDPRHPSLHMVDNISRELRLLGDVVHVHASDCALESARSLYLSDSEQVTEGNRATQNGAVHRSFWFLERMASNLKRVEWDRQVLNEFHPDVVLAHQDSYCWSVVKAASELQIPCVIYADWSLAETCRLGDRSDLWHPPGVVEGIEKWGLQRSQAAIAVSRHAAERLHGYGTGTTIHVNPNGIDPADHPSWSESKRRERRVRLGLGSDHTVIGFQGDFESGQGLDRLRDMIVWTQNRPEVSWLLLGDGPERRALEDAVQGCANVVSLGRRGPTELRELLGIVDIAVSPCSSLDGESHLYPPKVLEHAASGCAAITDDQGDIPLLLANSEVVEIVSDDQLSSWTDALAMLIDNREYRTALGDLARHHVLENFTWRDTAVRVRDVIKQFEVRNWPSVSATDTEFSAGPDVTAEVEAEAEV